MTENKRFILHIEWYNPEKTEGEFVLKDGGQPLGVIESIEDARLIRDTLNELNNENQSIKKTINELHDAIKFDIDNGFEVYPKMLVKYIMNTLKVIGDFE